MAQMCSCHLGPSPKIFTIIVERFATASKPDRAFKLFMSMHEHGCFQNLNSVNTILDIFCKLKRIKMAHNLFKMLKDMFKANCVSYNIIANEFCLIKRTPKVLEVLKEVVEKGLNPSLTTYNIMLKGILKLVRLRKLGNSFCK